MNNNSEVMWKNVIVAIWDTILALALKAEENYEKS
jgi:hypothetical protein